MYSPLAPSKCPCCYAVISPSLFPSKSILSAALCVVLLHLTNSFPWTEVESKPFLLTPPPPLQQFLLYKDPHPSSVKAVSSEIKWLCKSSRPCLVILIWYTGWNRVIIGEVIINGLSSGPPPRCLSACSLKDIGRQTGPISPFGSRPHRKKSVGHGSQTCDKRCAPNWRRTDYVPEEMCDEAPGSVRAVYFYFIYQSISFSLPLSLLS